MIAKKVTRLTNSRFKKLAEYIAAAKEENEKLGDLWTTNTMAGDDLDNLDMSIIEIEHTQSMNDRAQTDKTYHLVLSFRDERPKLNQLKEIEHKVATALGFDAHQRVVGTHINTENFHMHIAYNKVHPVTYTIHTPYYDFKKLKRVCRQIEKEYGLKAEPKREKYPEKLKMPERAITYEAQSWQQSFYSYVLEHKKELQEGLHQANSWEALHKKFAEYSLFIERKGNGLVIRNIEGDERMKASDLGRDFSKKSLENKLGAFQAINQQHASRKEYNRSPLTSGKGQERLWNEFLQQKKKKKKGLLDEAYATWKSFLMKGILNDPDAMALVFAMRQFGKGLGMVK